MDIEFAKEGIKNYWKEKAIKVVKTTGKTVAVMTPMLIFFGVGYVKGNVDALNTLCGPILRAVDNNPELGKMLDKTIKEMSK